MSILHRLVLLRLGNGISHNAGAKVDGRDISV